MEASTQLFFADSISPAVYSANSTYSRGGTRDTLNSADSIYNEESPALQVSLTATPHLAKPGTVSMGILEGVDLRRLGRLPVRGWKRVPVPQRALDSNELRFILRQILSDAVLPQVPQNTLLAPFLQTVVLHQDY